ncbi:MAG: hypothetical protein WA738_06690 [Candidatus Angelobacter sp.]
MPGFHFQSFDMLLRAQVAINDAGVIAGPFTDAAGGSHGLAGIEDLVFFTRHIQAAR